MTADSRNGVLCTYGPPQERRRHWILKFEDADVGDMHFDNEMDAMAAFRRYDPSWNCTLFVTARYPTVTLA